MKFQISNFKFQILFLIIFFGSLALFPTSLVQATDTGGLVPCRAGECEPCDLLELLNRIVKFFLVPCEYNNNAAIVPLVAMLILVIGGAMFFLSAGDPAKTEQAKSLIKTVVIGLILIYAAWFLVNLFFQIIGINTWVGLKNWWEIKCE